VSRLTATLQLKSRDVRVFLNTHLQWFKVTMAGIWRPKHVAMCCKQKGQLYKQGVERIVKKGYLIAWHEADLG